MKNIYRRSLTTNEDFINLSHAPHLHNLRQTLMVQVLEKLLAMHTQAPPKLCLWRFLIEVFDISFRLMTLQCGHSGNVTTIVST